MRQEMVCGIHLPKRLVQLGYASPEPRLGWFKNLAFPMHTEPLIREPSQADRRVT
jgi:hypothetical protein